MVVSLISCSNRNKDASGNDPYEKGKMSVAEIEARSPVRFLKVETSDKKNLIRQTVIKGTIFNNAKIVTYKDIELRLRFFSKTGVLLEEEHETVYEEIAPGKSQSFKSKYYAAKGSDSVGVDVLSAKSVE